MSDIDLVRTVLTLAAMAGFFAIVWWAYAPSRKGAWEARGLLDGDDQ
jgi:cbb3-type cytochrome oxidase subunit 3